jgi:GH24 family phage-related lysozyme (muramidase)
VRQSVRDAVLGFTEGFEGGVPALYNDVRGIPTIAFGNAMFTPSEAAGLALMHPGGVPATPAEKVALWHTVHDDPQAAHLGWRYAATLSDLRLTREGMSALAFAKLDSNDRVLAGRLPDWESYNGCVQLAMHSWAWAAGPNGLWPRLFKALADRDFQEAAVQVHLNEWTPEGIHNVGLVPRNIANKILMRNAARVDAYHLDPETVEWRTLLGIDDVPTIPAVENPASSPTIHVMNYCDEDDPPFDP